MNSYCPHCEDLCEIEERTEKETVLVKTESIEINSQYFVCQKCKRDFSSMGQEEKNIEQAYEIYRQRHNLLHPEDIRKLREKYGFSQRQFARLLLWSEPIICQYESGRLPDVAHNEVLRFVKNPLNMRDLFLTNSRRLNQRDIESIRRAIYSVVNNARELFEHQSNWLIRTHFDYDGGAHSGNRRFNMDKFIQMIAFFVAEMGSVYKTKLNKLPFYADFLYKKLYGESITGMVYLRGIHGPVPKEYDEIFGLMKGLGIMDSEISEDGDSQTERFFIKVGPNQDVFSKIELDSIKNITSKFKHFSASQIEKYSHEEVGFRETKKWEIIDYEFAQSLSID